MQFGKLLQFHNYKSYLKRNNLKEFNTSGIRIETLREHFQALILGNFTGQNPLS